MCSNGPLHAKIIWKSGNCHKILMEHISIIQRTHLLFCVLHSNWRVVSFYSVNQDKRQVCMYIVFWYVTILCFCSGPWWYESMRIVLFGKILLGKKEIFCGLKSQLNCESLDLFYAELEVKFSKNYWSLQKLQNVIISENIGSRY